MSFEQSLRVKEKLHSMNVKETLAFIMFIIFKLKFDKSARINMQIKYI